MDFSLCGETIKTLARSLAKKLIPIAVIASCLKRSQRERRRAEGCAAIIAAYFPRRKWMAVRASGFSDDSLFREEARGKNFTFSHTSDNNFIEEQGEDNHEIWIPGKYRHFITHGGECATSRGKMFATFLEHFVYFGETWIQQREPCIRPTGTVRHRSNSDDYFLFRSNGRLCGPRKKPMEYRFCGARDTYEIYLYRRKPVIHARDLCPLQMAVAITARHSFTPV